MSPNNMLATLLKSTAMLSLLTMAGTQMVAGRWQIQLYCSTIVNIRPLFKLTFVMIKLSKPVVDPQFGEQGRPTPKGKEAKLLFWPIFPKNCMKMKKTQTWRPLWSTIVNLPQKQPENHRDSGRSEEGSEQTPTITFSCQRNAKQNSILSEYDNSLLSGIYQNSTL